MLKPLSTNKLIFDGKNEKFKIFEDLFYTMLKMQPEMTEPLKINHIHANLQKEALQAFRNRSASYKKILDDVLIVLRWKICQTRNTSYSQTQMAQFHVQSQYKITVWILRLDQRIRWKSVRCQGPTYNRQFFLSKTATPFESITQLRLHGKGHILANCCTSRKKIRPQLFEKRWGADNTYNDSRTSKW